MRGIITKKGNQNIGPAATMTRASVRSWQGGVLPAGALARPAGSRGRGMFVEEGTKNLFSATAANASSPNAYAGATGLSLAGNMGTFASSIRIARPETGIYGALGSCTLLPDTAYTLSVFVQMDDLGVPVPGGTNRDLSISISGQLATPTAVHLGGGIYHISATRVVSASPGGFAGVVKYATQSARTFRFTGLQIEAKSYATSYQDPALGARAAEILTLPTTGLNPASGTITLDVLINSTAQRRGGQYAIRLTDKITLYHATDAANWILSTKNDAGTATTATIADALIPVGWRKLALSWDAASAVLYVDGLPVATIDNPNLPSAFPPFIGIGCSPDGTGQLGTTVDNIGLYSAVTTIPGKPGTPPPANEYCTIRRTFDAPAQRIVIGRRR